MILYNRYNNNPENLCRMNSIDHIIFHSENSVNQWEYYKNNPELLKNRLDKTSTAGKKNWKNLEFKEKMRKNEIM